MKTKHRIGGISRKGNFRRRESDQSHFFWKESIVKSFNFQKLGKISGKGAYKPEIKLAGASRITRWYLGVMF